jgi:hypothetical protein
MGRRGFVPRPEKAISHAFLHDHFRGLGFAWDYGQEQGL